MAEARYDAVADFYTAAFGTIDDPASADAALSPLRHQVGANHRMVSTYLNAFRRHGLWLDELAEPAPEPQWTEKRPGASRVPVYLAGRCLKAAR